MSRSLGKCITSWRRWALSSAKCIGSAACFCFVAACVDPNHDQTYSGDDIADRSQVVDSRSIESLSDHEKAGFVRALMRSGTSTDEECELIIQVLNDNISTLANRFAIEALGVCKCNSDEAIRALEASIESGNFLLREAAATAIGEAQIETLVKSLLRLLESEVYSDKFAAQEALQKFGVQIIPSVLPLILANDPSTSDRARLICRSFGTSAVPVLESIVDESTDTKLKEVAQRVLLEIKDKAMENKGES